EVVAEVKAVTIVCAGRIISSRDRNAIVSGRDVAIPAREFGDDPTLGSLVKDHRWVAKAEVLAGTADATPDRLDAIWAQDSTSNHLINILIYFIHPLYVLL